jgi:hypothetical protein
MSISFLRFTPTEVIDFFRRMTKEAVTYREQNNVKRNDFLQLLIHLKEKAEDLNNSKDKSIPWYKSKYHTGANPCAGRCL